MSDATSLPDLGFLIGSDGGFQDDYVPPEVPAFDVEDALGADYDGWPESGVPGGESGDSSAWEPAQASFESSWNQPHRPSVDPDSLTRGLNDRQREAVTHAGSPLLILAGAGSGKTRVLTHRIAYLLATGRARAGQILAITFTNKAAAEMRERAGFLVGDDARRMWVSTFHSACVRLLRYEHEAAGLSSSFTIYDAQDSQRLIQMVLKAQDVDIKRFTPKMVAARISDAKNELIGPARYTELAGKDPVSRIVAAAYVEYDKRMRASNALDFDDLIMRTVELLRDNPLIAEHYHRRFRHILVDEYQDTNHAQYVLVRALVGDGTDGVEPAELTVVGDSDQSIYAFRGATIRNIEEFERDFAGARTILLEQNYRSTQNILSAANAVIARNTGRRAKNLWTASGDGALITLDAADSEHDEARFVVGEIDRLAEVGTDWGDIAIFYRTNAQSRALEELLVRQGIPYRVVGGTRFYERREIKDALAYLQVISNPDDTVAARRILNVPKRGIGAKAEEAIAAHAARYGISFGAALRHLWLRAGCPAGEGEGIDVDALAPRPRTRPRPGLRLPRPPLRGRGRTRRQAPLRIRARLRPRPRPRRRRRQPESRILLAPLIPRACPIPRAYPRSWASPPALRSRRPLSGDSSKCYALLNSVALPRPTSSKRSSTARATSRSCAAATIRRTPRAWKTWRNCTRSRVPSRPTRPAAHSRTSSSASPSSPTRTRCPQRASAVGKSPS